MTMSLRLEDEDADVRAAASQAVAAMARRCKLQNPERL